METQTNDNPAVEQGQVSNEAVQAEVDTNVQATGGLLNQAEPEVQPEAAPTQEEVQNFLSSLPDDLRNNASLQKYKDVAGLAKSHLELESAFGKRLDNLSSDEVKKYYAKLGAPESVEGYGIDAKQYADVADESGLNDFLNTLHSAGVSKDAAKIILDNQKAKIADEIKMQQTEYTLALQEQEKQLRDEFGSAFDARLELAKNAVKKYGGDELLGVLNQYGLGSNPAVIKAFAEIGKLSAEDVQIGEQQVAKFGITPEEAQAKIDLFYKDKVKVGRLYNPSDSNHEATKKELEDLYKIKRGLSV